MHIFHSWGKWQETGRGEITRFKDMLGERINERKVGEWVRLERTCAKCGMLDITTKEISTLNVAN